MAIEQEIVTWLEQHSVNLHLHDVSGRKAFLFAAGLDELQNTLELEGVTLVFCRNFVQQLRQHGSLPDGRDPLVAVLEAAKTMVGRDKQAECDAFIARLHAASRAANSPHTNQRQHKKRILIGIVFVIVLIGIIAVSYHLATRSHDTQLNPDSAVTPAAHIPTPTPLASNVFTTEGDQSPIITTDDGDVRIDYQGGFQNHSGGAQ